MGGKFATMFFPTRSTDRSFPASPEIPPILRNFPCYFDNASPWSPLSAW